MSNNANKDEPRRSQRPRTSTTDPDFVTGDELNKMRLPRRQAERNTRRSSHSNLPTNRQANPTTSTSNRQANCPANPQADDKQGYIEKNIFTDVVVIPNKRGIKIPSRYHDSEMDRGITRRIQQRNEQVKRPRHNSPDTTAPADDNDGAFDNKPEAVDAVEQPPNDAAPVEHAAEQMEDDISVFEDVENRNPDEEENKVDVPPGAAAEVAEMDIDIEAAQNVESEDEKEPEQGPYPQQNEQIEVERPGAEDDVEHQRRTEEMETEGEKAVHDAQIPEEASGSDDMVERQNPDEEVEAEDVEAPAAGNEVEQDAQVPEEALDAMDTENEFNAQFATVLRAIRASTLPPAISMIIIDEIKVHFDLPPNDLFFKIHESLETREDSCQNELQSARDAKDDSEVEIKKAYLQQLQEAHKDVEQVLHTLEFCCGENHRTMLRGYLVCSADDSCKNLFPGASIYEYESANVCLYYCQAHFDDLEEVLENEVEKSQFVRSETETVDCEPLEQCTICERFSHKICRRLKIASDERTFCCERNGDILPDTVSMSNLKDTGLSTRIQGQMKEEHRITIKEVYSEVKNYFKTAEGKETKDSFKRQNINLKDHTFRIRQVVASQKQDDIDVYFLIFTVKEYPKLRWCSLDYLDSVKLFQCESGLERTNVFHSILQAYYDYAASIGYQSTHIWAFPPDATQDYFFNYRPGMVISKERMVDPLKQLMKFYESSLIKGHEQGKLQKYRTKDLPKLEGLSVSQIFNALCFSGFWIGKIKDTFEDYQRKMEERKAKFKTDEFKKHLIKELKKISDESTNQLLYFDMKNASKETIRQEKPIFKEIASSRDAWLKVQVENKWEFGTTRKARYASLKVLHMLVCGKEAAENDKRLKWKHHY